METVKKTRLQQARDIIEHVVGVHEWCDNTCTTSGRCCYACRQPIEAEDHQCDGCKMYEAAVEWLESN